MRPQAAGYYGGDGLRCDGVERLNRVRKPDPSASRPALPAHPASSLAPEKRSSGMGREARPGHPFLPTLQPSRTGQWPSGAWGRRQLLPASPAGERRAPTAGTPTPCEHVSGGHRHPSQGLRGPTSNSQQSTWGQRPERQADKGLSEEFRPQEGCLLGNWDPTGCEVWRVSHLSISASGSATHPDEGTKKQPVSGRG